MTLSRYASAFLFAGMLALPSAGYSQLAVVPGQPAAVLAAKLAGPGISILSPTLTCPTAANGTFISVSTPLTLDSGILLTTGRSVMASGPESSLASTNNGVTGDPALAGLALTSTLRDACTLEFDFVPKGDTVSFNYQFGSEEYNHSTCGPYNDAFAFFISGPGISGTQNMALVPGTTIPVTVNSVNSGIPGTGYTLANCTLMGPGSPFTSYFYDNTGGTQLSYKGFTKKLLAFQEVIPCQTYHLKISICDAGNGLYDSGVFIEAGSLKTNAFTFNHADSIGATIAGVPHAIVKGCAPTTFAVITDHPSSTSHTMHFSYGGTGLHGVDFSCPDSIIIPAGADSATITIAGIPTLPAGVKTLTLYLTTPYSCGIADSVMMNILDSPSATILTPDTTICAGATFQLRATGTAGLTYSWSPPAGLSSSTAMQPFATPPATTTYVMTATLPASGCPAITHSVTVTVLNTAITMLTPPTSICTGGAVSLSVAGDPSLTYSWSPATGLSNASIQNPIATPVATTSYTVTATGPGGICPSAASVTITISSLFLSLFTTDTTICNGASFGIRAAATTGGPIYTWSPATGLSDPAALQPVASPSVTTTYTVTASWPGSGCTDQSASFTASVVDALIAVISNDTTLCLGAQMGLLVNGSASLTYSWQPAVGLDNPNAQNPTATPLVSTTYTVTATSAGGLCTSSDVLSIMVANADATLLSHDTTICYGASARLVAIGSESLQYQWIPSLGISDPFSSATVATPSVSTTYTLIAQTPGAPCTVTRQVTVRVIRLSLSAVTADQTIAYGSSIQLNASGSDLYWWTPDNGSLNNNNISNPVATPTEPTTYVVNSMDSNGCRSSDSVHINLSYDDIFLPSAFTPNQDGHNDLFRIGNLGLHRLVSMSVFDRWGNLVYNAIDGSNKGWDGTYYGKAMDMGTYYYIVVIQKQGSEETMLKGDVTLLR